LALTDIRKSGGRLGGRTGAIIGVLLGLSGALVNTIVYSELSGALRDGRGAAKQMKSFMNLREVGFGLAHYHADFDRFPPAVLGWASAAGTGQSIVEPHSWRVALLPYLEQKDLYKAYDQRQTWDAPANRAVLSRMPEVYFAPGGVAQKDSTHYQAVVGPNTMFDPVAFAAGCPRSEAAEDGSHTILIVEAERPVLWTKPEDLEWTPGQAVPRLGLAQRRYNGDEYFCAAFVDGSVRHFSKDMNEQVIRSMTSRKKRQAKPVW
jgi:hypothetical protein